MCVFANFDKGLLHQLWVFLLTFMCGGAYEWGCVFWVHHSERRRAQQAAMWSCFCATMTVVGVESFLKSPIFALAYIIGFGTGTYLAIRLKDRIFGDEDER